MRRWSIAALKALWGAYWILTALYCLLAYLPYTYCALIKAPPYAWMVWFVQRHVVLYGLSLLAAVSAFWPHQERLWFRALAAGQLVLGGYLVLRPVLASLRNDGTALLWSIAALAVVLAWTAAEQISRETSPQEEDAGVAVGYPEAVLAAMAVALLYALGTHLRQRLETHAWTWTTADLQLLLVSILSHATVAVGIVTVLNAVRLVSAKTSRPRLLRGVLTRLLVWGALWIALGRFLENSMSFQGVAARAFAGMFAAALTLLGVSIVSPLLAASRVPERKGNIGLLVAAVGAAGIAVALPSLIGDGDWNGILQSSFTVLFWGLLGLYCSRAWPRFGPSSALRLAGVALLTFALYKGALLSSIVWAKPLGATDDDIARRMEGYAAQDASFELAHHLLGNGRNEVCGDLCRILREHTNIRNARALRDVNLVEHLAPSPGEHPDIFLFVIDSLRPDYLGAYNPKVDYTPNIDALARDGVVMQNAYTQYAGTTLSVPAIWSGALQLHAHYPQPFSRLNSLEKLAHTDGYQIMVSYDTILPELLSPSDELVKLDTDKLWNSYELCSTVEQTEHALDTRMDPPRPVLFYTQPMNVHQFAKNDWPTAAQAHWASRPGLVDRVAYEAHQVDVCLGRFVDYLKAKGRYDRSIIVLTADHGDATGEFGRHSHSLWIYPEIMRVPLIIHLPKGMAGKLVYDARRIATLTDLAPTLFYLNGHRPIVDDPLYGRPLFTETKAELDSYGRSDFFLASDARAAYGFLSGDGRFLYATYDSPPASYLFDLNSDPNAEHSILTDAEKKKYDERIIGELQQIADYYGYKPAMGSLLAAQDPADRR